MNGVAGGLTAAESLVHRFTGRRYPRGRRPR